MDATTSSPSGEGLDAWRLAALACGVALALLLLALLLGSFAPLGPEEGFMDGFMDGFRVF